MLKDLFETFVARQTRLHVHVLRDTRQRPLVAETLTLLKGQAFPRRVFPRGSADEVTGQVARAALVKGEPRRVSARLGGVVNVPCRRIAEEVCCGAKRICEGRGVGFDGPGSPCVRIPLAECVALRRGRDGREEAVQL